MKKCKLLSMLLIMTICLTSCSKTNNETIVSTDSVVVDSNITDGLEYDEASNTWFTTNEDLSKFVEIMQSDCSKSADIQGAYILATDDEIIFIGGINSTDVNGNKVDAYTTYEIGSLTKAFTATAFCSIIVWLL